jgi:hypothetical protein
VPPSRSPGTYPNIPTTKDVQTIDRSYFVSSSIAAVRIRKKAEGRRIYTFTFSLSYRFSPFRGKEFGG